ncbi:CheY-like receiver (fragment) [Magnetospirillum sp. UT-4]
MQADNGESYRASAIIDKAFVTARMVEQLLARRRNNAPGSNDAAHHELLVDAQERLINLMLLAQLHIEASGCSANDVAKLQFIHKLLIGSAESLVRTAIEQVIRIGNSIISGQTGVPMNIGNILKAKMDHASLLASVVGGAEKLPEDIRSQLLMGENIVLQVNSISDQHLRLPHFDSARRLGAPA